MAYKVKLVPTHVNNDTTAVQMLVKLMKDLPQLFRVFLIGLQKHSLEVDWQSIPIRQEQLILNFIFTKNDALVSKLTKKDIIKPQN